MNTKSRTFQFLGVALCATALGVVGLAGAQNKPVGRLYVEGVPGTGIRPETPVTFGAFAELTRQAAPAVVSIEVEGRAQAPEDFPFFFFGGPRGPGMRPDMPGPRGAGSGFFIREDGYLLSNNHVVEDATSIQVSLEDGRRFPAKLVGRDPATDVSLLKVDAPGEKFPVVALGNSEALQPGEWVVAIGNPMGLSHTVTAGIVSAKHRGDVHPDGRVRYADFIQTDASINPGNSGGPLFNIRGEVVGINTAINAAAQGIGFAIPIDMVKKILPALYGPGHVARSWIGVQIQAVTAELARSFGLDRPRGALVAAVVPDGPAAAAGVKPGDVVTRFDGTPVQKESDLPWLASTAGIGRTVDVEVHRDGAAKTLKIKLEAMPGADREARGGGKGGREDKAEERAPGAVGMRIAPLDRALAERLDVKGGVAIVRVEPGTPAARAGLRRGDVILQLDGREVSEPKAVAGALETLRPGQTVRLWIQRGEGRQFVALSK
jgi:serine protease Do